MSKQSNSLNARLGMLVADIQKTAHHEIYCDEDDHSFHPQKLKGFIPQVDQSLPIYVQRLQYLLSGIRRTLGKGDWTIEWIDDGEICWLVQISECKLPSAR